MMIRMLLCSLLTLLCLSWPASLPALSAASPSAAHYIQDALVNGKQVQRWNDDSKVIYVTIKPGTNLKNWDPSYPTVVKQAFSQWQQVLNNRFTFAYTNDPRMTDITVEWWQKAKGSEVGLQTLKWSNNTITEATINIALWNPQNQPFNRQNIYGIALHEIGHVLGIRGHSSNPNDIMYYSMDERIAKLSSRDINTIRVLYQQEADITNPKGTHLLQYRYYEYYARLGAQALVANQPDKAVQYFAAAKKYYSHDQRINLLMGLSAYGMSQYEQAIQALIPVVAKPANNEEMATGEFFLAQSYLQLAKQAYSKKNEPLTLSYLSKARQHFDHVVRNPDLPPEFRQTAMKNNTLLKQSGLSLSAQ